MSAEPEKTPHHGATADAEDLRQHNIGKSEVLVDKQLMNNAFEGENREHEEGVWESAKAHPMACFWAFVFCFTIVRSRSCARNRLRLTRTRSWNHSICS